MDAGLHSDREPSTKDASPISRSTILILSWVLIGMSIQSHGFVQANSFLCGCFGLIAYIGLEYVALERVRRSREQATSVVRDMLERRVDTHINETETIGCVHQRTRSRSRISSTTETAAG